MSLINKTIFFNFPEDFIADHHAGLTIAMFQVNKFTVAKLLGPIRHFRGHDVCMDVNLQVSGLKFEVRGLWSRLFCSAVPYMQMSEDSLQRT